jgi:acetyl esterase/lipase
MSRTAVSFLIALLFVGSAARAFAEPTITEDVIYGHKAGMALTLDVVQPDKPNGAGLLYMVSTGWVSNYFPLKKAIADSERQQGRFHVLLDGGYTLFMVRHGSAPQFTVPEAVSDVRRAARFIRMHAADWNLDPNRLGVFGNSAGGHLALMLALAGDDGDPDADDPVEREPIHMAAAGIYYAPVDLRPIAGNAELSPALAFDASLGESVSPIAQVSSDDPPTLLIHGDKDTTVPMQQSEILYKALEDAGVPTKYIVMKGAGHAFPGKFGREAAAALRKWFDTYLKAK